MADGAGETIVRLTPATVLAFFSILSGGVVGVWKIASQLDHMEDISVNHTAQIEKLARDMDEVKAATYSNADILKNLKSRKQIQ